MLKWIVPLVLIPTLASADRFEAYAPITEVVLHPEGAWVYRAMEMDIPSGAHVIVVPVASEEGSLFDVTGATVTSARFEQVSAARKPELESSATASARALVRSAEQALAELLDQRAAILLPQTEGNARLRFLEQIGDGDGLAQMGPTALQNMVAMIGRESRAATELSHTAEIAARALDARIKTAQAEEDRAKTLLAQQVRDSGGYMQLVLDVVAEETTQVQITQREFEYDAGWTPIYEVHLSDPDSTDVRVVQYIRAYQQGGEAWNDVSLTLSTGAPLSQSEPGTLYPKLLQIVEPAPALSAPRMGMADAEGAMMEPVIVAEEASRFAQEYDGLTVTTALSGRVTIPIGQGYTNLSLPDLSLPARPYAVAVPSRDDTAFLVAEITNGGPTPLPGDGATVLSFVNGAFVGESSLSTLAVEATVTLPFGPIEGLQISETVLDDNAGDRGILRGQLFQSQTRRIDVENLTPRDWEVQVFGQVPYSGQEDLEITWNAAPQPDAINADDKRGILRWDLDLAAGATSTISLDHRIKWPEGMVLR